MKMCPKCGASPDAKPFIGTFCVDCYPVRVDAPHKASITVCKRCGAMSIGGEWKAQTDERMQRALTRGVSASEKIRKAKYDHDNEVLLITLEKDGNEITVKKRFELEMVNTTCPRCSRISGGYYEAIIQLRGDEKKVAKHAKMLAKRLEQETFISKTKEEADGYDMYVGNSKAVLALMNELGLRCLITRKLAGVKESGKRAYRTTFLLRFGEK